MTPRRDRGVALVLVMTVILALSLIATPFVLSMLMQEQSGTVARYASEASYGAEGVRNYAVWRLMHGVDPMERRYPSGAFSSYFFDTLSELEIRLDDPFLRTSGVLDPQGDIWGVVVQDEQSKLNPRTAPSGALGRIQDSMKGQMVDRKNFITLYSGREATWIFPQRIRGAGAMQTSIATSTSTPATVDGVSVDTALHYGQGSRVRATKPGQKAVEAVVRQNRLIIDGQNVIETDPAIDASYANGILEVEARHPVNPNTARRETLMAIFEGCRLHGAPDSVDRAAASIVANALAGKVTPRLEQFVITVAGLGLSPTQKGAVILNAIDPTNATLAGSGTVPLCFKSFDVYTIEASASANNPAGTEVAGRGFREVVDVSPPNILRRFLESQYDFDQPLNFALVQDARYGGYPYGSRWVTFPNALPNSISDTVLKPLQPANRPSYVQPAPARDYRGQSAYQNDIDRREHFDDTQEGKKLDGGAVTYRWDRIFSTQPPKSANPIPPPDQRLPYIATGGVELEVRFDRVANPMTIFDLREEEYMNRMTLRVENGELIFTVCDATLGVVADPMDNGAAEIRQPFVPVEDTWYHFGAYYKNNHQAQLALLVNGFGCPDQKFNHVNPEGTKVRTRLAQAMTLADTGIALVDAAWVPTNAIVALRVGGEVMVWDRTAGMVQRGARGTLPMPHPADAVVEIFGYSSKVRNVLVTADFGNAGPGGTPFQVPMTFDRITKGGATVKHTFGQNPQATVFSDKQDPTTMQFYVDAISDYIGVQSPDIEEYPEQGYIMINQEVIFYTSRVKGPTGARGATKFVGCVRAQHGTTAAQHTDNAPVFMWAVPVTDLNNYLSPTIIQVDDEWFGPVQKDPVRPQFWISFVTGGNPVRLRRGNQVFGSPQQPHASGQKVIPTFVARESDPNVNLRNLGPTDAVTLTNAANRKEPARVRQAGPPQGWNGNLAINVGGAQLAGFWDNVTMEYVADDLHTRVLKFPSGELLGLNWLQTVSPDFSIGPGALTVDEIKFFASPREPHALSIPAGATDSTITLNDTSRLQAYGGLLKMGDEYVGYGEADKTSNVVSRLKRSWLSSTAGVRDIGEAVFHLPWVPVSTLSGDLTATDRAFSLRQRLIGERRMDKGYVLIEGEMIGFEWGGAGVTLSMPPRFNGLNGLFRGMFGTRAMDHKADECLVYAIPFRFWDGYKPQEFDNRMPYYQWSTKMDAANWRSYSWTQEIPAADKNIVVHALARIDGKGEFFDTAGVTEDKLLYESTQPESNAINRISFQNDAGQFDLRFYVEYRPGSFDVAQPWTALTWRRAPRITQIQVEYDRPTRVLYHEDR